MKAVLLLFFIFFLGCNHDNFYGTQRSISTDKNDYVIGDTIEIILKIATKKENKTIKFYENFKNLEISFSTFNAEKGNQNTTLNSGINLKKTKKIERFISKKRPFIVKFKGKIKEIDNRIELSFPELNFKVSLSKKDVLEKDTFVRIHGFCNPINPEFGASLEEYFEIKDIKITEN